MLSSFGMWNQMVISVVIFGRIVSVDTSDPCDFGNYQELGDLLKRSPSFTMDSVPLCDRYLTEGWYSTPNYLMPTSPPTLGKCGTLYPFWMNDTLPVAVGDENEINICGLGFSGFCQNSVTIKVKKCQTFLVYKLVPLGSCNSAYCFEKMDEDCVAEVPSNPTVIYHGVSYTKDTSSLTAPAGSIQWNPIVQLRCQIDPLPDISLYYHVQWYVDNTKISNDQVVNSSSLTEALFTTGDLWKAGKKIGCLIQCVVGAKKSPDSYPCNSTSSSAFFAGIEVLTQTIDVERKGEATVRLRPTIPYARPTLIFPFHINQDHGNLPIALDFSDDIKAACTVKGAAHGCEIKIPSFPYQERHKYADQNEWHKEYTMTIYNKDDLGYKIDNNVILRLKTSGNDEKAASVFNGVSLPDIPINIVESKTEWKGEYCYSLADPHMRTFDKYPYECQENGCTTGITYLLYRNTAHDQEVQVRHHKCIYETARCICSLAARSGKDVFIFDACNGRQYINFPVCDDSSLTVIKELDKSYKIFFPTGTYVKTTLQLDGDWFLQTYVYPSVADVDKSSGMCGILGNGIDNDLTRRNGVVDNPNHFDTNTHPNDFSISWRVENDNDLFSMDLNSLTSLGRIRTQLCTCNKPDGEKEGKTECSYKSYTDCGTISKGKQYPCLQRTVSSRRKRHADYVRSTDGHPVTNNDVPSYTITKQEAPLSGDKTRRKRDVSFSEDEATIICNSAFEQSVTYQTCIENVADVSNDSIHNCILDVALTGDSNLTSVHIESAIDACQVLIKSNVTLQEEQPTITYQILSVCINNCSGNGQCIDGNCTCDPGFGGSDCGFDITAPPTITSILGNGFCDRSVENCDDATMFGSYFLENSNTTCFVTRHEISDTNTITSKESYENQLDALTLFEGSCTLLSGNNDTWVTQFVFALSNDRSRFTGNHTVYVYQSQCQTFNNVTGNINFTLQDGYCYIDGSCIRAGELESNTSCWKCDPAVNSYNWTEDCSTSMETTETSSTTLDQTAVFTAGLVVTTTDQTSPPRGKKSSPEESDISTKAIGLLVAISVVTVGIFVTSALCIKKKFFNERSNSKDEWERPLRQQDNLTDHPQADVADDPINLFAFGSQEEFFSRPPSRTSFQQIPPTNDFRHVYSNQDRLQRVHKNNLDEMFSVKN